MAAARHFVFSANILVIALIAVPRSQLHLTFL